MKKYAENVDLLYLINQDTKSLTLAELYKLYADTVKQVEDCAAQNEVGEKPPVFSFD